MSSETQRSFTPSRTPMTERFQRMPSARERFYEAPAPGEQTSMLDYTRDDSGDLSIRAHNQRDYDMPLRVGDSGAFQQLLDEPGSFQGEEGQWLTSAEIAERQAQFELEAERELERELALEQQQSQGVRGGSLRVQYVGENGAEISIKAKGIGEGHIRRLLDPIGEPAQVPQYLGHVDAGVYGSPSRGYDAQDEQERRYLETADRAAAVAAATDYRDLPPGRPTGYEIDAPHDAPDVESSRRSFAEAGVDTLQAVRKHKRLVRLGAFVAAAALFHPFGSPGANVFVEGLKQRIQGQWISVGDAWSVAQGKEPKE